MYDCCDCLSDVVLTNSSYLTYGTWKISMIKLISIDNLPITRESVASNLRTIGIMHRGPRLEVLCLCQPAFSPVQQSLVEENFLPFSPYLSTGGVWRRILSIIVMGIVLAVAVTFHNFVHLDGIINTQCEYYTVISVQSIRRNCPFYFFSCRQFFLV